MRFTHLITAAAAFTIFGCDGTTEPADELVLTMQNIAGVYSGVTFTTEDGGVVTDQLRRGATIELILNSTGTSSGRLFVPPDTTGCCGQDVNLSGQWGLNSDTVTLDLVNDCFLDGIPLVFAETHLSGETTLDSVLYRVVLAW